MADPNERERRARTFARWRLAALVAAIAVPSALVLVFMRRSSQLDVIATEGGYADAMVTEVPPSGDTTFYAYVVDSRQYVSSVRRDEAPYPVGEVFRIAYLPDDPSVNLPIADRRLAADAATHTRRVGWSAAVFLAALFGVFAWALDRDVRRLRDGTPPTVLDARTYRRRLARVGVAMGVLSAPIFAFHAHDALARGESLVPVAIGALLGVGILATMFIAAAKDGPLAAPIRLRRWVAVAAPIAAVLAALRWLAFLFGI